MLKKMSVPRTTTNATKSCNDCMNPLSRLNVDETIIGAKSLIEECVINVSPIQVVQNIISNDVYDVQS